MLSLSYSGFHFYLRERFEIVGERVSVLVVAEVVFIKGIPIHIVFFDYLSILSISLPLRQINSLIFCFCLHKEVLIHNYNLMPIPMNIYTLSNIILVLIYYPMKQYFIKNTFLDTPTFMSLTKESSTIYLAILLIVFKIRKCPTQEYQLNTIFFYSKLSVLFLIFQGENYGLLMFYFVLCFCHWLIIS